MDLETALVIGIPALCLIVAVITINCMYCWRISDQLRDLKDRVVRLETIWDVRLADVGKTFITKNESISEVIQEEK